MALVRARADSSTPCKDDADVVTGHTGIHVESLDRPADRLRMVTSCSIVRRENCDIILIELTHD
jgi:hypothetical protein